LAVFSDFLSNMCSGTTPSCPPHLGIVLYLLSTSSQQFAMTLDSYKQQHRKYSNLSDLSADEIKQVGSYLLAVVSFCGICYITQA